MTREELITNYMTKWQCTREEAISIIEEDEEVDSMTSAKEINSDLTDEQKKAIKKMTSTTSGNSKNVGKHKTDEEKVRLIKELEKAVLTFGEDVSILKAEREITFKLNGSDYSVVLTKHRAKKA